VKVGSITKCVAAAAVILGLGTGCTGIATTQSFSPLMFFLPGLVDNKPGPPQVVPDKKTAPPAQVASIRVLVKTN
jgi:hypothetical protein